MRHFAVSCPSARSFAPLTRCEPPRMFNKTLVGSGTRAFSFSRRNIAALRLRRLSISAHFVPSSYVRFFSGSRFALFNEKERELLINDRSSAEGLKEVPKAR